ncbi:hypothetical protein BDK51DRAFT_44947 [Blyttiomyces helicus]|uniref:Uncharacterized protein n=1 Tax=Blyttiomyces helicus TaxID=388810 RepID=A0A4P9WI30_9FUNG|nr:hypothetical protein BDK51DRAFT_44947 [Blyttiomyces helicus]|eukprot:RKO91098.1 hypothetical protein BDK51DRAFT_44947 [Blyttiomyces helicus]
MAIMPTDGEASTRFPPKVFALQSKDSWDAEGCSRRKERKSTLPRSLPLPRLAVDGPRILSYSDSDNPDLNNLASGPGCRAAASVLTCADIVNEAIHLTSSPVNASTAMTYPSAATYKTPSSYSRAGTAANFESNLNVMTSMLRRLALTPVSRVDRLHAGPAPDKHCTRGDGHDRDVATPVAELSPRLDGPRRAIEDDELTVEPTEKGGAVGGGENAAEALEGAEWLGPAWGAVALEDGVDGPICCQEEKVPRAIGVGRGLGGMQGWVVGSTD